MASIMTIRLNKSPGSSWGFRLQGGKDFATPLCIQKVNVGSVAEQAGLQAGDAIVSINNGDALAMRHKEAQDAIVKAGNNFELVVQRGSQIWKPAVTALPETKILSDGVPVATKTSLAANQKPERKIGSNYNCVPRPFPGSFNKSASPSSSFKANSPPYSEMIEETKCENTNGFYSSTPQSFRKNSVEKKSSSVTSHPIFNIDEATLDLTISGTGITLDKEKAKNFLIMTLDKENNVNTINLHKSSSKDFSPVNGNINGNSFRSNSNLSHANISGTSRSPSNSSICSSNSLAGRGVRKLSYGSNCSSVSSASSHDGDNESTNNYQKDTYKPIGTGHNAAAAPFQLVNAQYNSPVNIYSEDSIAETLSAQAEVLGKGGVLGVNFMKNDRSYDGRASDVLRMVHEMDKEPQIEAPGTPTHVLGNHDKHVAQGYSFKLLQRALDYEDDPSVGSGLTTITRSVQPPQPGGAGSPRVITDCSECERPIIGVFVRIKNKNLHADCFKCSTCGSSLKNVGYYNINDKLYCDIHAKQAARSNPPAPNLVPVTVQPGAVPPPGVLTAPQASKMKIPSAFQQGGPAFIPAPAPAPAPPQTEIQQSEPQELPEPLPAPVFESTQIQSTISEVSSQSHLSSQIVENEGVALPPILNGDTFASQEEGLQPPQETLEKESKPIENGYVEDIQNVKEHEVAETLPPKPYEDTVPKEVVTSFENGEVSQAPATDVFETKEIKTDLNNIEPHPEVEKDVPSSVAQEPSQDTEIPSQREPSPVIIDEHPQEVSQSFPTESSQDIHQELSHESVQTHLQENIQEFSETQTQKPFPELAPEQSPLKLQSSEFPESSLINNVNSLVHLTEGAISNISHFRSEESHFAESKFSSSVVQMSVGNDTATQRAPAPAPAPVKPFAPAPAPSHVAAPVKPAPAPSYSTSANPQGFGAPAGDINVRAHIPKKGDVPAPMTFGPVPGPVPVPISNFGSNTMPKPIPPPGTGGKIGPGGPPARGVPQAPGHRSAPRRGRGVMNQASASRIPVCNACQRQIRGPFVSALGKTWCPDHFICATTTCKRNIIDMGFVEEKGLLYCENCYESFLAPICGKCDKRIKGDCLNAVGKQFHPECFCCAYCGKVFGSGAFYLEDGLPYCETDWNDLFTTKCVGCNFPIEAGDRWVEALNNNYHSQCFKCSKCNKNLEGQSFFAKGGKPFCKAHAQRGLI